MLSAYRPDAALTWLARMSRPSREVIVYPTGYIGVFHWQHSFGPDRIAVRIHVSDRRPMAEVDGFRDFEVTSEVGCGGGPGWTTIHPAAFHGPLKHFLDKNKIR